MKNGRDGLHTKAQPAGCQSLGPVQPKCKAMVQREKALLRKREQLTKLFSFPSLTIFLVFHTTHLTFQNWQFGPQTLATISPSKAGKHVTAAALASGAPSAGVPSPWLAGHRHLTAHTLFSKHD